MTALAIKNIDISGSVFLNGIASEVFVDRLTEKLGGFVARAMSSASGGGFAHYICSSTLDITCSAGWFEPEALTRKIQAASGLRCSYSNAMQCATWGFLVRQHLVSKPDVRNILISVVDANPLGMRFWDDNVGWGKTGHRVTLVHLQSPEAGGDDVPNHPARAITVSKCNPTAALYDYALEIQRKRSLDGYAYLPDLYEEFGHLCGSDPWMSIARDVTSAGGIGKRYLASSFASEGYCCFLSVATDAQSRICIEGHA